MFLFRKNIILVPSDYDGVSNSKGLISLDCYDSKVVCSLKIYNLSIQKPLTLGLAINNKVNKINVNEHNFNNLQFEINDTVKNTDNIACVLLDILGGNYKIMLWGSTQINNGWKASLQSILDEVKTETIKDSNTHCKTNNLCEPEENICKTNSKQEKQSLWNNFKEELCYENTNCTQFNNNYNNLCGEQFDSEEIEISKNENCDVDADLSVFEDLKEAENKTEVYSYEEEKLNNFIDKVIDMTEDNKQESIKRNVEDMSFYERINPQIEKMFKNNKQELVLNEILPNSKFCRVEFEDGNGYYVFGIIYDDGLPKYLCYGVPAKKDSQPPQELSNLYQWLPIDATDDSGDGYYMMYQDALTGKNIALEII